MYKLKQTPEDFIVEEISDVKLEAKGPCAVYLLRKKDIGTEEAVDKICKRFNIQRKNIGYAGNKDKKAVTSQYISIKGFEKKKVELENIELELKGFIDNPISLGRLEGNKFVIIVRNLDKDRKLTTATAVPNYFDEQRFSSNNAEIGKLIVKKDFEKAVAAVVKIDKRYGQIIKKFLDENPKNFVAALKKLPRKTLMLYIHAYQSYLFNKTIKEYLKKKVKKFVKVKYSLGEFIFPKEEVKNIKVPLVGFGTEVENEEINKILLQLLKKEEVTFRDFIIQSLPELSQEGDERDLFFKVKDLKIGKPEKDELNKKKYKVKLEFTLPKGCYATLLLKFLLAG